MTLVTLEERFKDFKEENVNDIRLVLTDNSFNPCRNWTMLPKTEKQLRGEVVRYMKNNGGLSSKSMKELNEYIHKNICYESCQKKINYGRLKIEKADHNNVMRDFFTKLDDDVAKLLFFRGRLALYKIEYNELLKKNICDITKWYLYSGMNGVEIDGYEGIAEYGDRRHENGIITSDMVKIKSYIKKSANVVEVNAKQNAQLRLFSQ